MIIERLNRRRPARGMRVVLDGVFNHASRGFFYFNDIVESGQASPYIDWFTVNEFPLDPYDLTRVPSYKAWYNLHALPKFNTNTPAVREFLFGMTGYEVAQHALDRRELTCEPSASACERFRRSSSGWPRTRPS